MSNNLPNDCDQEDLIIGQTIVNIRPITKTEMEAEYWGHWNTGPTCSVLELSNGARLYPSRDSEGNGPGCLYGITPNGHSLYVIAESD